MKNKGKSFLIGLFALYVMAVVFIFIQRPFTLKTDMMDIIPPRDDKNVTVEKALKRIAGSYIGRINILFMNENADRAKAAGGYFAQQISDAMSVTYDVERQQQGLTELLLSHNYRLLSEKTYNALKNDDYGKIAGQAQALAYSPISVGLLPFAQDPFFLSADFLMNLRLAKSGFSITDGVLSAFKNGSHYVYLSADLRGSEAMSPAELTAAMETLEKAEAAMKERFPDVAVNISGVPVHSYRAMENSIYEMNLITVIALLFFLAISYGVFRSGKCFIFAALTIGTSIGLAFMLTAIAFGGFHVLVLVFGASLIGLCLDYHIHYFIEKGYSNDVFSKIGRAIKISLLSSLSGFVIMMVSGILLVFHMAFFAATGLANTYVIIRFIYPAILGNYNARKIPEQLMSFEKRLSEWIAGLFQKRTMIKISALLLLFAGGIFMAAPNDSIRELYRPDDDLLQREILFAEVSGTGSAPLMLVVEGKDTEEVLEREEETAVFLEELLNAGKISGYKSVSQLIPSRKRQEDNYRLAKGLFAASFQKYAEDLGLSPADKSKITEALKAQEKNFITLEKVLRVPGFNFLESLFLQGKEAYSVMLVDDVTDKNSLARYAAEHDGIAFVDRMQEISDVLKAGRQHTQLSVAVTSFLVFCFLSVVYRGVRKGFIVIAPSLLAAVMTLGTLGFCGVPISLFHILALFLIICFGVDYSVFRVETTDKVEHAGVAVLLSFLTTLISFGSLAFTGFAVTKALGMTLGLGLLLSYLLSPIATAGLSK